MLKWVIPILFIDKCPEEWVYVEGSASKCFRYFSKRETWSVASEKCQEIGGELATIDSKADNEYIFLSFHFVRLFCWYLENYCIPGMFPKKVILKGAL